MFPIPVGDIPSDEPQNCIWFVAFLFSSPPEVVYIFTTVYYGIVTVILVIFIVENYGLLCIKG